jgi:hypothetical protein
MEAKRNFISIYFDDALVAGKKKRDVTISFPENDDLYLKCKEMGSTGIKNVIKVYSYVQLLDEARAEDRTIGNYIKRRLKMKLDNG